MLSGKRSEEEFETDKPLGEKIASFIPKLPKDRDFYKCHSCEAPDCKYLTECVGAIQVVP